MRAKLTNAPLAGDQIMLFLNEHPLTFFVPTLVFVAEQRSRATSRAFKSPTKTSFFRFRVTNGIEQGPLDRAEPAGICTLVACRRSEPESHFETP
jgi:hypothetical protein